MTRKKCGVLIQCLVFLFYLQALSSAKADKSENDTEKPRNTTQQNEEVLDDYAHDKMFSGHVEASLSFGGKIEGTDSAGVAFIFKPQKGEEETKITAGKNGQKTTNILKIQNVASNSIKDKRGKCTATAYDLTAVNEDGMTEKDSITVTATGHLGGVASLIHKPIDLFENIFQSAPPIVSEPISFATNILGNIHSDIHSIIPTIGNPVSVGSKVVHNVGGQIHDLPSNAGSLVNNMFGHVSGAIHGIIPTKVGDIMGEPISVGKNVVHNVEDQIHDLIPSGAASVGSNIFGHISGAMHDVIPTKPGDIMAKPVSMGSNMVHNVGGQIHNLPSNAGSLASGIFGHVSGAIHGIIPTKVGDIMGEPISVGKNVVHNVEGQIHDLIPSGAASVGSNIFGHISGAMHDVIPTKPVDIIAKPVEIGSNMVHNVGGQIHDLPSNAGSLVNNIYGHVSGAIHGIIPTKVGDIMGEPISVGKNVVHNVEGQIHDLIPSGAASVGSNIFGHISGAMHDVIPTKPGDIMAKPVAIGSNMVHNVGGQIHDLPSNAGSFVNNIYGHVSGAIHGIIPTKVGDIMGEPISVGKNVVHNVEGQIHDLIPSGAASVGSNIFGHISGAMHDVIPTKPGDIMAKPVSMGSNMVHNVGGQIHNLPSNAGSLASGIFGHVSGAIHGIIPTKVGDIMGEPISAGKKVVHNVEDQIHDLLPSKPASILSNVMEHVSETIHNVIPTEPGDIINNPMSLVSGVAHTIGGQIHDHLPTKPISIIQSMVGQVGGSIHDVIPSKPASIVSNVLEHVSETIHKVIPTKPGDLGKPISAVSDMVHNVGGQIHDLIPSKPASIISNVWGNVSETIHDVLPTKPGDIIEEPMSAVSNVLGNVEETLIGQPIQAVSSIVANIGGSGKVDGAKNCSSCSKGSSSGSSGSEISGGGSGSNEESSTSSNENSESSSGSSGPETSEETNEGSSGSSSGSNEETSEGNAESSSDSSSSGGSEPGTESSAEGSASSTEGSNSGSSGPETNEGSSNPSSEGSSSGGSSEETTVGTNESSPESESSGNSESSTEGSSLGSSGGDPESSTEGSSSGGSSETGSDNSSGSTEGTNEESGSESSGSETNESSSGSSSSSNSESSNEGSSSGNSESSSSSGAGSENGPESSGSTEGTNGEDSESSSASSSSGGSGSSSGGSGSETSGGGSESGPEPSESPSGSTEATNGGSSPNSESSTEGSGSSSSEMSGGGSGSSDEESESSSTECDPCKAESENSQGSFESIEGTSSGNSESSSEGSSSGSSGSETSEGGSGSNGGDSESSSPSGTESSGDPSGSTEVTSGGDSESSSSSSETVEGGSESNGGDSESSTEGSSSSGSGSENSPESSEGSSGSNEGNSESSSGGSGSEMSGGASESSSVSMQLDFTGSVCDYAYFDKTYSFFNEWTRKTSDTRHRRCAYDKTKLFSQQLSSELKSTGIGAVWDEKCKAFFIADRYAKQVLKFVPSNGKWNKIRIEEKRIDAIVSTSKSDEFLIATRNILAIIKNNFKKDELIVSYEKIVATFESAKGFSLVKTDPYGRMFIGVQYMKDGKECEHLYKIVNGVASCIEKDIKQIGGMAWDLEKMAFYISDIKVNVIYEYSYDMNTGDIKNRKMIFDFKKQDLGTGVAHDISTDAQGNLWVAYFGTAQILKINTTTWKVCQSTLLNNAYPTSIAFAGKNLLVSTAFSKDKKLFPFMFSVGNTGTTGCKPKHSLETAKIFGSKSLTIQSNDADPQTNIPTGVVPHVECKIPWIIKRCNKKSIFKCAFARNKPIVQATNTEIATRAGSSFYDSEKRTLYLTDMFKPSVLTVKTNGHIFGIVKHLPLHDTTSVSAVLPIKGENNKVILVEGKQIVARKMRNLLNVGPFKSKDSVIAKLDIKDDNIIFDLAKLDVRGRLWVVTKEAHYVKSGACALYLLEKKTFKLVEQNLNSPGGMAWSNDQKYFYLIDRQDRAVYKYSCDFNKGTISGKDVMFSLKSTMFENCTMKDVVVDKKGYLWITVSGGYSVLCLSPDGKIKEVIALPDKNPTTLAFGGSKRNVLFVTTSREDEACTLENQGRMLAISNINTQAAMTKTTRFIM